MAGFILRAILAFLWNPLSGATPFRNKRRHCGSGRSRRGKGKKRWLFFLWAKGVGGKNDKKKRWG